MKKIATLMLCLLLCGMTQAQNNVKITLTDGNVVEGVTKYLFMLDGGNAISLKTAKGGEKSEYKSADIKSVDYLESDSKEWVTFVPLMAQRTLPSVWNKNPKPYKEPVFLSPVYEGKHVSAYIHYITTATNTKTVHLRGTNYVYYFKVHDEDVARSYCMGSMVGLKMLLKIVFKPYPVMKEAIADLDTKAFAEDPVSLIRTFDGLLK